MFFGDMGGNFYALDAVNGQKLWGQKIGGAIAGGVITYTVNGTQKVAAATGFTDSMADRNYDRKGLNLGPRRGRHEQMRRPWNSTPSSCRASSSRFVISFHIIFPAFTIGLAAWLATIETMRLATGNAIYRRVFDFWLKVFAVSFGMGVVPGIVMAFQFGTNWSVLAERSGPIQGPLLGYETFTAFLLEASFFGVMLLGRGRVAPWFYVLACWMVSLGTMASSFWILANNSWMQVPLGHAIVDGLIVPDGLVGDHAGPVKLVRWPHMLLAAFLTTGMCVIATGAWYTLRASIVAEARVMLHWGLAWSRC